MAEQIHNTSQLTDADWNALEEMASRLEDSWKTYAAGGRPVDLAAFLPDLGSPLRKPALHELIKVDLECRWRRGQSVSLDYYVDKFSDLGRPRELPAKLVFEEYRVRQLFGDKPALAVYQTRFPSQFDQLQRLLAEEPLPTVAHLGTVGKKPAPEKPSSLKPTANKVTAEVVTQAADQTLKGNNVAKTESVDPHAPQSIGHKNKRREVGEYREIERLGAGAFGEVWKVELPGGIMKAVKIIFRPLDHEEAQRELESLELIKGLRHHFLLQTISFSPSEDRLRIWMDLADGSLRDLLKQAAKEGKKGLPLHDLARWLREAAEALDYLHEKGVQHRDIKPENILLSEGSVRVADFGLARHQATRRLASGSGAGTPLYMPPESWNDKQHANSDQYSLAATYAECRLGRRVFEGDGLATLMQAHVHDRPKLDPLPADEQQVLLKALSKNPDHRYSSCTAFAEDLIRAVAKHLPPGAFKGLTIVDAEMSVAGRRARKKQKQIQNVFLGGALVSVLAMAAIVASFLMSPANNGKDPKDEISIPAAGRAGPIVPVAGTEVVEIGGKKLYKQIECHVGGNPALAVRFNLIPWTDKGKQSFYLMENKVSNDLYEAFAQANPWAVNGSRWRLGARGRYKDGEPFPPFFPMVGLLAGPPTLVNYAAIGALFNPRPEGVFNQDDWPLPNDYGARNPRWPVLRVDVQEANLCAEWLGGALPSAEEWDKAAGRFEPNPGEGPYRTPYGRREIAIDEDAPLPVGTASKDVSAFSGCRDMAGNGLEWTRTYNFERENGEFFGNVNKVPALAKAPLRGRSYRAPEPLAFADLESRPVDLEFFQRNRVTGSDSVIGFRVAILP